MISWIGGQPRSVWSRAAAVCTVGGLVIIFSILLTGEAGAHGTMQSPPSRSYTCRFMENPEQPSSAACRAAVAAGGTQPVYDWNEINIANAGGRHQELIPDGRLCSAGRDKYRGFDLARADWPATRLPAGGSYTFTFMGSAPHQGTIELYLTRDGYDPSQPLRWSDLETTPLLSISQAHAGGHYGATATLPSGKHGRHLIYAIWQRSDSPEAFYSCSDVVFGDDAGPGSAPQDVQPSEPAPAPTISPAHVHIGTNPNHTTVAPVVPAPVVTDKRAVSSEPPAIEPSPSEEPAIGIPAWKPYVGYAAGVRVSHGGLVYECVQGHSSLPGWEPSVVFALWQVVFDPGTSGHPWQPQVAYPVGARVWHGGVVYECMQAHMSLPGWEPANTPALWRPA